MSHLVIEHQNQSDIQTGWLFGAIGMVIFGGSLVATRIGVADFDPIFFTVSRAVLAALYAGIALLLFNKTKPCKADLLGLVGCCCGRCYRLPIAYRICIATSHGISRHRLYRLVALVDRSIWRVAYG